MNILISILWVIPALSLMAWTVATFIAAQLVPLSKPIWPIFGTHPLLMMRNPKDDNLYERPTLLEATVFVLLGCVPVVNLLFLGYGVIINSSALMPKKQSK